MLLLNSFIKHSFSKKALSTTFYSTSTLSNQAASATVPLSFVKYDTYKTFPHKPQGVQEKKQPLIICHGLFGSKQNWRSLAKSISVRCQCEVYTIDARNHGESPHVDAHSYELMANDVLHFIQDQGIENPMLLGHSMGGKVMMEIALRYPTLPAKLCVVDIAPIRFKLTDTHKTHVQAMREINAAQLTKQKEADLIFQKYEPDLVVRQFHLTNLKKNLNNNGIYEFRIPFEILGRQIHKMGDFVQSEAKLKYEGSTLFITGSESPYRREFLKFPDLIHAQFPNSRIENIQGAGHWVQTEKPDEFLRLSSNFINEK